MHDEIGVCHGDITCETILITYSGNVKIGELPSQFPRLLR